MTLLMTTVLCTTIVGNDPSLRATASREDTKIAITATEAATVVNIACPFGIDRATIERTGDTWPPQIVLQLQLKGLESLEITSGPAALLISVPSTGQPQPNLSLRQDGKETVLDKTSEYWTEPKLVGGGGKIPLENGYFEVLLPAKVFEANPPSIQLRWVDFYRN